MRKKVFKRRRVEDEEKHLKKMKTMLSSLRRSSRTFCLPLPFKERFHSNSSYFPC